MTFRGLRQPTPLQESVLRAALLPPEEALPKWTALVGASADIPDLDQGLFRLLPLVSRNLGQLEREFPARSRLRGIYRQAWYRNQVAANALAAVLPALAEARIHVVLLKGLAAVELAYHDLGVRPMNDADILVRPRDFIRARDVVAAAGFAPVSGIGRGDGFRTFHAVAFRNANGIDIDLHHHMLEESCWPHADDGVWTRATEGTFGQAPVLIPAPEDLIINLFVHGTRWDPVPSIRWIADAALLVRSHAMDWELVAREAQRREVSVSVGAALRELARFVPVPEAALEAIALGTPSWLERADFRSQQAGTNAATMVARYLTRYGRLSSRRSLLRKVWEFPTYLQGMWELDSRGAVLSEGGRRVMLRLRGKQPTRGTQGQSSPSAGRNSE